MTRGRTNRRKAKKKKTRFKQRKHERTPATAEKRTRRSRLSRKALIAAVVSVIVIVSTCVFWVSWSSAPQQTQDGANTDVPKAAILDSLSDKSFNAAWTETMVQYLSNAGYTVDVYNGVNVTIDLLRDVGGYEILILRVHSTVHTDDFLYVFSGEVYTESMYVDEQLTGVVKKAYTFNESEPPYFALNSVFIGRRSPEGLNGTTLVMAGCNGTATEYVIQSFFQEGGEAYISWDGYVNLPHSDEATLGVIKAMCVDGLSPEAAVKKVKIEVGPDPAYGSQLSCALP